MNDINKQMAIYPVSKIQHQFWIINRMFPGNPAYNMASVFRITGPFHPDKLRKSINGIIERHEILRTTFIETDEGVMQIVHESMQIDLPLADLSSGLGRDNNDINESINSEVSYPFNLQDGPLIRCKIFLKDDREYYLCITLHHIITDLHSKNIFSGELSASYNSPVSGIIPEIQEQIIHYRDYSIWENEWIKSADCNSMIKSWQERLAGGEYYLNLPLDHIRRDSADLKGSVCEIIIPENMTERIKAYSRLNSINIFVTLLAAYYILLYRYTYQDSIIIGLPLTNRRKDKFKEIMGCLMNIVPLRVDDIGMHSFDELVISVRKAMLEAHRNQEVPVEEIISHLKPQRIPGVNPLYQTAFAFEPPMKLNLAGAESRSISVHPGGSQLDLFMTLWEEGGGVHGRVEYNSDLFERITIENLAENYTALIETLLSCSSKPVSEISLNCRNISCRESFENKTGYTTPDYSSVSRMIEERAESVPEKTAALCGDAEITYSELNNKANQLAHYLADRGAAEGSIVGVYLERSIEMLISLIAIHKTGAAYLPLDPDFPAARIGYMIEHSKLETVITQKTLSGKLPGAGTTKILIDEEWQEIIKKSDRNIDCDINPESLAYVMYTSGSTGNPKGVMVTHSSVVNFLKSMSKRPGLNENDTLLAVTTISFDISVLELFLPLSQGAKTVILPKEVTMDGGLLIEALEKYKPTVMQATPATWKILFSSGWGGSEKLKVLCGGEALPCDLADKLVSSVSEVWNMYGPTETTVWSTCFRVSDTDTPVYIGEPIDNTSIYILDNNLNPLPAGVPGEIYIGGAGVAGGYIHAPELTYERFLKNPFKNDESWIYKTGDTGRITYSGNIEFFSRIDNQVKVRGYRIELREIELNINQYEGVSDSAAAVIKDPSGEGRIAAYIITDKGRDISTSNLRLFLQERLPGYMIPDFFITMDKLPLTPNNKVDRKSLPLPDFNRYRVHKEVILPAGRIEEKIAVIWKEILSVDVVSMNDNYFDLGGNSFLAVQIINRINRELSYNLNIMDLFRHTTVSALAKFLSSGEAAEGEILDSVNSRTAKQKEALARQKQLRGKVT
ncbi:MAG TPA: amino acid adenylation domain-containing protein [Spirochaetota bacterium]|nr:amino acid adenylation domain-containing protein [Spirochaetota bacterium]